MNCKHPQIISLIVLVIILCSLSALADCDEEKVLVENACLKLSGDEGEEQKSERWQFDVSTFGWFPVSFYFRVNTKIGGFSQRLKLRQLMKMYRGGGMAYFTARKGDYGLFADVIYGDIERSVATNYDITSIALDFPVEDEIKAIMVQFGGLYRLRSEPLAVDCFAGLRYLYLKSSFAVEDMYVFMERDFIEPLIGSNVIWNFGKGWALSAKAGLSGFGLGSEITKDGEARISYSISKKINCYLGYRILDTRYQQKAGDLLSFSISNAILPRYIYKDIRIDARGIIHGPIIGLEFRW